MPAIVPILAGLAVPAITAIGQSMGPSGKVQSTRKNFAGRGAAYKPGAPPPGGAPARMPPGPGPQQMGPQSVPMNAPPRPMMPGPYQPPPPINAMGQGRR